jgi:transglutaminase-like putative cysteine protease
MSLLVALGLCLSFSVRQPSLAQAAPTAGQPETLWYTLALDDKQAGWSRTTTTREADHIVTETETRLSLKRNRDVVTIHYATLFRETPEGQPVSAQRTDLGDERAAHSWSDPGVTTFTFSDSVVRIEEERGGKAQTREIPRYDGAWLTPASAREYVARRLAAGAEEINYRTIDLSLGAAPIPVSVRVGGSERLEARGETVAAFKCEVEAAQPPVRTVEWITPDGVVVRSEAAMGALTLTRTLSTESDARAAFDAPEIVRSSLVRPDRKIPLPRMMDRAVFVLRCSDGRLPEITQTPAQRVEVLDDGAVRVSIDGATIPQAQPDTRRPDQAPQPEPEFTPQDLQPYLAPSKYIDSDDPRVIDLAERAPDGTDHELALRLRYIARAHIRSATLDVGFVSASHVAESRKGDCTEHAVLLAAMLRARGIPSRVVSGLIYAPRFAGERDVFAFHMWTQALVQTGEGTRWIDLDSTGSRPFDATHIAIAASALADEPAGGSMSEIAMPVADLLGQLSIEVESAK